MGCDIHICMETCKDGTWTPLVRLIENKYYRADEEAERLAKGEEPGEKPEIPDVIYKGRNYDLFAMLADVRNGYGFAGHVTGLGFVPICAPRGVPNDAHSDSVKFLVRMGIDGHSHSWHTLATLEGYDWDQTAVKCGWVDVLQYASFKRDEIPYGWVYGVMGQNIKHISPAEMDALCEQHKEVIDDYLAYPKTFDYSTVPDEMYQHYTQVKWQEPYRDCVERFLTKSLPRLRELAKEEGVGPEDIRLLFFFDC